MVVVDCRACGSRSSRVIDAASGPTPVLYCDNRCKKRAAKQRRDSNRPRCFVCQRVAVEPVDLNLCGGCLDVLVRHCFRKIRDRTRQEAEERKAAVLRNKGVNLWKYTCKVCAGHHVTSRRDGKGTHAIPIARAMLALGLDGQDLRTQYLRRAADRASVVT